MTETQLAPFVSVPRRSRLPDTSQWINRFEVRSETSNAIYVIAQNRVGRWWGCSCMGWIRHHHCKHLCTLALPDNRQPKEITLRGV
jgi:hypothetical protein